ncbi:ATP-binding cassette subfamily B protein [Povalibacter uvarum]|uniref:ATP-binding cassette subfamily B protein n=1 Tax=Povalibacter uvarum TaxID=732238 RepID=A0A841HKH3_9GAMM|nr:ABC transporter transmembrane domain-containing protein [Povalibacter uvarum]MBB6093547.1 ATP-binding cassette subfamily B protein [Povalibacter uvarum]
MEPDRPKSRSLKPLRSLWPYLRAYKKTLALALGALLIASGAMLVLPLAFRGVIDQGMVVQDRATIDLYFIAFLGAAAVFGLFAALRFYLVTWLGERVVADLRSDIYQRVIRMDPTFFEVTRTGEVLSRLTTDTTLVQSIAGVNLSITLRSSIQLVGALVLLVATSPSLAGMILLLIPFVIVPLIVVGRKLRTLSRQAQDKVADTSGLAGETLNAIQTVQAFTLEQLNSARYGKAVEESFVVAIKRTKVRAVLTAVGTMMIFGAVTFVLWQGAHRVLANSMTGGELSQFLIYAVYVAISAASLSEMWGEVQRAAGAMERLVELKNATPAIVAPANPQPFPAAATGHIRFDHVSFRYPSRPDTQALENFTLDIQPGENVAFVGPSGAGKSTTFQLLLRFYDPAAGRIVVDGVNIADAKPEDVRQRIGLVPQETVLFGASARENIRYGRPNATSEEIEAAARAAGADTFIRQLPEGYDTFLGERGTRLSGGQRQRIAIARALLKDPPILLLDEATSSLDAESERYVQEALERLMEHRTTIIIAHRLATILKADRIVVLDHGRITAIGTHAQLLATNELYARLAALQFADFEPGSGELRAVSQGLGG